MIHTFLLTTWRPNWRYRLSAVSRATRIMFLIFAVKSSFLSKNAKTKCVMNEYLITIVRKRSHSCQLSCCIKKGTPLPCGNNPMDICRVQNNHETLKVFTLCSTWNYSQSRPAQYVQCCCNFPSTVHMCDSTLIISVATIN